MLRRCDNGKLGFQSAEGPVKNTDLSIDVPQFSGFAGPALGMDQVWPPTCRSAGVVAPHTMWSWNCIAFQKAVSPGFLTPIGNGRSLAPFMLPRVAAPFVFPSPATGVVGAWPPTCSSIHHTAGCEAEAAGSMRLLPQLPHNHDHGH